MSERQAKRLRRAQRAFIHGNRLSLARGEPVTQAAHAAASAIRGLWPALNHRERGDTAARLTRGYNAITNTALHLCGAS